MDRLYAVGDNILVHASVEDGYFSIRIEDIASMSQSFIDMCDSTWINLTSLAKQIDDNVIRILKDELVMEEIFVGEQIYVTLTSDFHCVNVSEFYCSCGELKPLPHGVMMTFGEWDTLMDLVPYILNDFPMLKSAINFFHDSQEQCDMDE
jgi:hypothetical protein